MADRTEELKQDIEQTRAHMTDTMDAIGNRVSPGRIIERRVDSAKGRFDRVSTAVMGAPRQAAQAASSKLGGAQDAVGGAGSSAASTLAEAPERAREVAEGNPIAAGAVAFGLGVLLGSLAPASEVETKVAEQVVPPLQEQITDSGRQVAESVKSEATEGLDATKSAATEAASAIKEHAADAAQEVRGTATDAMPSTGGSSGSGQSGQSIGDASSPASPS